VSCRGHRHSPELRVQSDRHQGPVALHAHTLLTELARSGDRGPPSWTLPGTSHARMLSRFFPYSHIRMGGNCKAWKPS
jgi:hypothetical protein